MQVLTANEAKTKFGDLLMKVQREPVEINKNGKPVAVMVSKEDYESIESMKLKMLHTRLEKSEKENRDGKDIDGEIFFDALNSGQYD